MLDEIQEDKILYEKEPTDEELLQCLQKYPDNTVITVSHRAANRINNIVIDNILQKSDFLGYIHSDCDSGRIPVYKHNTLYRYITSTESFLFPRVI